MNALALILFACWCGVLASAKSELIKWKTVVKDYEGKDVRVKESAKVYPDRELILMMASDPGLKNTPMYRSRSLHDFQKRLVALKPLAAKNCFIGKVKRSFEITLEELRRRGGQGFPRHERRPVKIVVPPITDGTGSEALDTFCAGRKLLFFKDFDYELLRKPWIRFPPLVCFWGPVDIFDELGDIKPEEELPSDIADFEGLFGPFP